jgi:hypothetical protein
MSTITQQNRLGAHTQQPVYIPTQPQHQRPSTFAFFQPTPAQQALTKQQNLSSPSLNVHELNQDLLKLKEQLKKLAERGEEMGANRARAEEAHSARVKLESSHQVPQIRTNTSVELYHTRKDASSDLIYYP